MLLVNVPLPVPSVVCNPVAKGPEDVLQHTPRAVTAAPPLFVMLPPETAVVHVGEDITAVVKVGVKAEAVNVKSFP